MIKLYLPNRLDRDVYLRLLQSVKDLQDGLYITKVPTMVPYSIKPTPFILEISEDLVGIPIQITRNSQLVHTLIPKALQTTIYLPLQQGFNRLKLQSTAGSIEEFFIGATYYAAVLQGIADELFHNVELDLQHLKWALESPWNPKKNEHLLPWMLQLPDSRAMRAEATRISVRAAINEAGTQRGVIDFLSALTVQTPIVVRLKNDPSLFDPILNPLFNNPTEFAGAEFNIWMPNSCMATWSVLPKLLSNVSVYRLIDIKDEQVRLSFQLQDENHLFELGNWECSLSEMVDLLDCFYSMWSWVKLSLRMSWASCVYSYPLDTIVEAPLGMRTLDMGLPLDSTAYETAEGAINPQGEANVQEDNLWTQNIFIGDELETTEVAIPAPPAYVVQVQEKHLVFSGSIASQSADHTVTDADFSILNFATSVTGGFLSLGVSGTTIMLSAFVERFGFPKIDGDLTIPGFLSSATSNFLGLVGKWVDFGGGVRQIVAATMLELEYSGLPVAGGPGTTFAILDEHILSAEVVDDNVLAYVGDITGTNRYIECRLWDVAWSTKRTLDTVDPAAPFNDGWIGLDLACRNDHVRTLDPYVMGEGNGIQVIFSGSVYEPIGPTTFEVYLAGIKIGIDDPLSSTFITAESGWGDIYQPSTGLVFGAIKYETGQWIVNTHLIAYILPQYETIAVRYVRSPASCYDTVVKPVTTLYSSTKVCVSDPTFCGVVISAPSIVSPDNILFCPTSGLLGKTIGSTQLVPQCNVDCCDGPCVTPITAGYSESSITLPIALGIGIVP